MGKQPAILIIARHGTRLDQANKDWQDTADKPWDSPLSYGGWVQCQNLGARIAAELGNLDNAASGEAAVKDGTASTSRPRKRRKIVIHSSPYLRCIQTSIGVAAGLRYPQEVPRARPAPTPFQRSSLSKPPMQADDATSPPAIEKTVSPEITEERQGKVLTDLKIDAWLGEWLSSGYFSKTQPPPPSEELVIGAKEFLKKPPEEIRGADMAMTLDEFDEFDWTKTIDSKDINDPPAVPQEKTGLKAMAARGYSMPKRTRTVSLTANRDGYGATASSEPVSRRPRSSTYSPPVPTYSIAPKDTIPIGFVAHARDACINPDYNWDSQQAPLEWGDGGQYEEEWSTMHRRFRNGLQGMLAYYESSQLNELDAEEEESAEDLVLILVTHQAGCNALIRLVTGAPALHDVGTASLTLAVRKPGLTRKISAQSPVSPSRRRASLDFGFDEDFDMKIIASTEHLRTGSNPLGLNSPRLAMSPAFASRRMVGADSLEGFSLGDPLAWRSTSQSTLPRSASLRGHAASQSLGSEPIGGTGLWTLRGARSDSMSSELGVDPRSSTLPTAKPDTLDISKKPILEETAVDVVESPVSINDQMTWQPQGPKLRLPVRKGSTILTENPTAGTGLWGSPVANPGGVKKGTPHSRGSFGMGDSQAPMWGARVASQRQQSSKKEFGAMKEEDES